jgi:GH25 family lysozyme M1 (1,4-beta-N-acetylmuramidase)
MGLHGVDVASYQGVPADWIDAAGALAWAAVKFTELEPDVDGGATAYRDPDAGDDWAWLGEQGHLRIAYLFGHPSVPADAQVALFAEAVTAAGLTDADGVALDFEVTDGLSVDEVATWAQDVMAFLARSFDRCPVLYTFLDFARTGYCDGLGQYPLWIADPSALPGQPQVPAPWASWAIHQYQISGQVDQDVTVWDTAAEMIAAIGKAQPAPAPGPAATITGEDDGMIIDLPAGAHKVFAPWPDAAEGQPPYSNVSMVLTGDTGAVVGVEFFRGGPDPSATQVHELASGIALEAGPVHKWPGITAVTLTRTDSDATATAAATVSRW